MFGNIGSAAPPSAGAVKSASEAYTVWVTASGGGMNVNVQAPLPEKFSLAMSAQWDSPFARSAANAIAGAINMASRNRIQASDGSVSNWLGAVGVPSRLRGESMQVWQESSAFTISIPLVLVAINDPKAEVWDKAKGLLQLCAPIEVGGMLKPPGPHATPGTSNTGGVNVTVKMGNFLRMERCVVKNATADFDSILHVSGFPMSATVNIEVETHYASCTVGDIDAILA